MQLDNNNGTSVGKDSGCSLRIDCHKAREGFADFGGSQGKRLKSQFREANNPES
jgi:hypothetical protein